VCVKDELRLEGKRVRVFILWSRNIAFKLAKPRDLDIHHPMVGRSKPFTICESIKPYARRFCIITPQCETHREFSLFGFGAQR
jgi:hypothetical protein